MYMLKNTGVTHHQLAVKQERGEAISHHVGGHVVGICMDTQSPKPSLFEMWLPSLSPEVMDEFRILLTEYTPPPQLAHLMIRRELYIEAKAALDRKEILVREYVAKTQTAGGVKAWPPYAEADDPCVSVLLVNDLRHRMRRAALPPSAPLPSASIHSLFPLSPRGRVRRGAQGAPST